MAKKQAKDKDDVEATIEKTSQARIELPSDDMDRIRRAAKSIGLSLSAFLRQAVLEKAVDVEKRMGIK